jgi:hypothetical protein
MTMGAQIPVIVEKTLVTCGCRKFQLDVLGYHLCPCTIHSGVKKDDDWEIEQPRMPHRTCGCEVNSPHNRTCGARAVNVRCGFFFFENRRLENSSVGQKKTFFGLQVQLLSEFTTQLNLQC